MNQMLRIWIKIGIFEIVHSPHRPINTTLFGPPINIPDPKVLIGNPNTEPILRKLSLVYILLILPIHSFLSRRLIILIIFLIPLFFSLITVVILFNFGVVVILPASAAVGRGAWSWFLRPFWRGYWISWTVVRIWVSSYHCWASGSFFYVVNFYVFSSWIRIFFRGFQSEVSSYRLFFASITSVVVSNSLREVFIFVAFLKS